MVKNNNNVLVIILFLLVILLGGYIIYDKITDSKENLDNNTVVNDEDNNDNNNVSYNDYTKENVKYSFEKNENYKSNIRVEDTYAIAIRPDLGKNIFILHDGKIYYNIDKCFTNNNETYCNFTDYNLSNIDNEDSLQLFDKLDNVVRLKSINYGTGIDYSVLAITNNGKVYLLTIVDGVLQSNEVDEEFKNYNVDDILTYQVGAPFTEWEVVLNDGTRMKKTIESR